MNSRGITRRAAVRAPWRRARGTAMIEFVMIIPFLGLILGLTFFFGWALMHKHQVVVADRYAAWKRIETGGWPSEDEINTKCFMNRASDVSLSTGHVGRETAEDLAAAADAQGPEVGELATRMVVEPFPVGRQAEVYAKFDADHALWQKFKGYIHHSHRREGITWRRDEVRPWASLKDLYLSELDDRLNGIPAPADGMAQMIRRLYLEHW